MLKRYKLYKGVKNKIKITVEEYKEIQKRHKTWKEYPARRLERAHQEKANIWTEPTQILNRNWAKKHQPQKNIKVKNQDIYSRIKVFDQRPNWKQYKNPLIPEVDFKSWNNKKEVPFLGNKSIVNRGKNPISQNP